MSGANTTEEIPPIKRRPSVEKPSKDSKRTVIALGLIAIAGLIAVGWALTQPTSMGEPGPGAATPEPSTPVALGEVTAAAGLPEAEPLTDDAIARMSDEWILAAFDGAAYGSRSGGRLSGPTVLYGIDPEGTTYEVVNMTVLGADAVVSWDPDRAVVLFRSDDGSTAALHAYDVASGSFAPGIDPCAGYAQVGSVTVRPHHDAWRIYALCRNDDTPGAEWGDVVFVNATTVDDRGQLITDRGTMSTPPGRFLTLVGDHRISWGYPDNPSRGSDPSPVAEEPPAVTPEVLAHRDDGATIKLDTPPDASWCRAAGPGRGNTVALLCVDGDATSTILAEAPLDGSPARTATDDWPGLEVEVVNGSHTCATNNTLALQTPARAEFPTQLLVSHEGDVSEVLLVHEPAQACFGSRDGRILVGGVEGVGWYDPADGVTRMLLTTPTPTMLGMEPDEWVQGVISPIPMVFPLDAGSYQSVLVDSDT